MVIGSSSGENSPVMDFKQSPGVVGDVKHFHDGDFVSIPGARVIGAHLINHCFHG
jgi:hypothetical protein